MLNEIVMEGTIFIKDQIYHERFLEIDVDKLEKNEERIEDIFDMIIKESRKDDEGVSWGDIKKHLRKKAKG
jgi:hypothetical protein